MKRSILKYAGLICAALFFGLNSSFAQSGDRSQDYNTVINTGVPFLTIAPDARGGGMGDVGVTTSPDATSLFWNPAKYAFMERSIGFQISYVPWLTSLVKDIGLFSLYGYWQINDKNSIGASLRYFSLGDVHFTNDMGVDAGTYNPNEFAIDATYARKFSEKISGAVAARFIYSNLTLGQSVQGQETKAGTAVAADIAFYYREPIDVAYGSTLSVGVNISNIGTKISYTNSDNRKAFIPTTLRFGPAYEVEIDRYNTIAAYIDISKLLVPTPPIYAKDEYGNYVYDENNNLVIDQGRNPDVSVFQGMIQSFYDAPGGFKEEMQEFMFGIGAEYWYNKLFGVRVGYFNESKNKGNRKYLGLGASVRFNVFDLGVSYIVPTNNQVSPQDNTLRFSLSFNFK